MMFVTKMMQHQSQQKIIFADDDLCICEAMAISEDNEILSWNEKIVFNLKTREKCIILNINFVLKCKLRKIQLKLKNNY